MKNKQTIVHLTSEVIPFYKRGGLGDVAGSLPHYLKRDCENYVISFHYQGRMQGLEKAKRSFFVLPIHGVDYTFAYYTIHKDGVCYYFIDLDDDNIFCDSEGGSKTESKGRGKVAYQSVLPMTVHFYFAKAALALIQREDIAVNFMLLHDWHVCGVFAYEKILQRFRQNYDCKTLLLIHNYKFQGELLPDSFQFMDEESQEVVRQLYRKYQSASLLGLAIEKADFVGTVSKGYADELMNEAAPHNYYKYLQGRSDRVLDFTNGVDYSEWHPQNSPYLSLKYDKDTVERKAFYKKQLLQKTGFADDGAPIGLLMARLTPQKGIYLLMNPEIKDEEALAQLENLLDTGIRLVVYGNPSGGETSRIHQLFSLARQHFPHRFYYDGDYNEPKAHQYLAGADVLLSPSFFEPCGLVQLYAMAYGTVPLVNPIGGLGETVNGYCVSPANATGFFLKDYSTESLQQSLQLIHDIYSEQGALWRELVLRGMEQDFSWENSIQKYLDFFKLPAAVLI